MRVGGNRHVAHVGDGLALDCDVSTRQRDAGVAFNRHILVNRERLVGPQRDRAALKRLDVALRRKRLDGRHIHVTL